MKKILILLVVICASVQVFAQKEIKTKATIQSAVVYLQGAEITNTFKTQIPSGSSTLIVQGIPVGINQSTIQVGTINGVTIQSTEYRVNYMNMAQKTPRIKAIEDSLETLNMFNEQLANARQVLNDELSILITNRTVGGANTGLSVLELQKLMDYFQKKSTEIRAELLTNTTKDKKLQETIANLNNQLASENALINQPSGEVVLQLLSSNMVNADFNLTYMTPNAGWAPIYDLRCENIQSKIKLFYKAQVWQNTGMAWNDVKLTISTGNPNESGTSPVIQPWYLRFGQQYAYQGGRAKMAQPQLNAYSLNNTLAPAQADAEGAAEVKSLAQYTTVNESQLNATFEIDLKYNIPNDGKIHLVSMIDYELPATYQYYAVPKLDKDAFLLARITDWEKLNLLPANTNIFFEGTYVGQSFVDTRNTRDTLSFSLGRDKKVIIKRQKIKDYSSSKLIGTNRKELFTYDITLRNTKKDAIELILLDQYPITTDKDIEIELLDNSNANVDAEKGQLTWRLKLNSQENKKIRLSYSVKYPKDKIIGNLN